MTQMRWQTFQLGVAAVSLLLSWTVNLSAIASPTLIRLTTAEVTQQLRSLPGWMTDGKQIYRTYEFANFVESVRFVDQLVAPAEAAGHHPDITINYNKVTVSFTTHDVGGLTLQDFAVARAIAQLTQQPAQPSQRP
jgi:4a-hydroxytetrahydrobiopterin dehydratase